MDSVAVCMSKNKQIEIIWKHCEKKNHRPGMNLFLKSIIINLSLDEMKKLKNVV